MMMAMLVLGSQQIFGCRAHEVQEVAEALPSKYLDMCPWAEFSNEVEEGSRRPTSAIDKWKKIRVIHCQATLPILAYTCNKEGQAGIVRDDRFREPCEITAVACRDAAMTCTAR